VDDRAQRHAAAVRERGVRREEGRAQTHACLRVFGTRDVAVRRAFERGGSSDVRSSVSVEKRRKGRL